MLIPNRRLVSTVTSEPFTYRQMQTEDILEVSNLVARVFNEAVAPEYSSEGVREFYRYIKPIAFRARSHAHLP